MPTEINIPILGDIAMFVKKSLILMAFCLWQVAFANESTSTQATPETVKAESQDNELAKAQPTNSKPESGNPNSTSNEQTPSQRIPLNIYCKHHTC
jgi:cytoskeletal protein RodZ